MAAWTRGVRTDTGGALNVSVGVWPSAEVLGTQRRLLRGATSRAALALAKGVDWWVNPRQGPVRSLAGREVGGPLSQSHLLCGLK